MNWKAALTIILVWATGLGIVAHAFAQPVESPDRFGATAVTVSATGTIAATAATIPAVQNKTAYLCAISIRANATAAATGNATITGLVGGTMTLTQWTAPLASGIGVIEPPLNTCIPASGPNVPIVATSAAPGAGGNVSVNLSGYYL